MPEYDLKQIVPWRDVLHVLRWHLALKIRQHQQACGSSRDGFLNRNYIELSRQGVEANYRSYRALRNFLGYHTQTSVEKEALELLSNVPPDLR